MCTHASQASEGKNIHLSKKLDTILTSEEGFNVTSDRVRASKNFNNFVFVLFMLGR